MSGWKSGRSQRYVCEKYIVACYKTSSPNGTVKSQGIRLYCQMLKKKQWWSSATLVDWGFPMDKTDLRIFVKSYLDKEGRQVKQFKNNYPGEDWSSSFVKRHRESLTKRLCQNISAKRAEVSKGTISKYFDNLTRVKTLLLALLFTQF